MVCMSFEVCKQCMLMVCMSLEVCKQCTFLGLRKLRSQLQHALKSCVVLSQLLHLQQSEQSHTCMVQSTHSGEVASSAMLAAQTPG